MRRKKEFRYKMLIYPCISNKNMKLEHNFKIMLPNLIKALRVINPMLHITYISNEKLTSVSDNAGIDWISFDYLRLNKIKNKSHYLSEYLLNIPNFRMNSFDILYTHYPQQSLKQTSLISNKTKQNTLKTIGYIHSNSLSINAKPNRERMLLDLAGLLKCESIGVNTFWLKKHILNKYKEYFKDKIINEIDKKIQIHYFGINKINFKKTKYLRAPNKKIILWNHQNTINSNFNFMIKAMDLLYKKRQDFEVHSTVKNADLKNKKWGKNIYFENDSDYNEYINKYIYLHINTYKTFSAWDIPTTDCLSMSIPTLCPYGFCYKEILDPEYPFFYQTNNIDDFINKVEMAIISPRLRNQAIKIINQKLKEMNWNDQIKNWSIWDDLFNDKSYLMEKRGNKKVIKATNLIRDNGEITHNELIKKLRILSPNSFSLIRNRLRLNKKIKFTKSTYQWRSESKSTIPTIMLTKKMISDLYELGYSDNDISVMNFDKLYNILNKEIPDIPFTITTSMKKKLSKKGYSKNEIDSMRIDEAKNILKDNFNW